MDIELFFWSTKTELSEKTTSTFRFFAMMRGSLKDGATFSPKVAKNRFRRSNNK